MPRIVILAGPLLLFFLAALIATPARAEEVTELWRGGGLIKPYAVSVNPSDGSCWVADTNQGEVLHLAQDGTQLWRGGGFNQPWSVSVNPTDGSCWVADTYNNQVVHLAEDGTQLWRGGSFNWPRSVSVNPTDGSCWVADMFNNSVVHLAEDGTHLWRGGGFHDPWSVSVNPTDGSCWVADTNNSQVVHLAQDGTQLWRGGGFYYPRSVSVNPADGSCWVADTNNSQVVHLAQDGTQVWRGGSFSYPWSVSVNPTDGSCWVADTFNNSVVHLAEDGTQLWRGGGFELPEAVSVNPTDGSCWVADTWNSQVVHLAQNGTQRWRGGGFYEPGSVSVNPSDGSCWVADYYHSQVVHLAQDGTQRWRGGGFNYPESVSVNPSDGSCWVADTEHNQVVHLGILLPGTLKGQVRVKGTTINIAGATVKAYLGGVLKGTGTTGANGVYSIPGLAPGTYVVTASKQGYVTQTKVIPVPPGATAFCNFGLDPLCLTGQVCIRGTTTPMPGATVTVLQGGATATTDANGIYQIGRSTLSAGSYVVVASKAGYVRQTKLATVTASTVTSLNFFLDPLCLTGQVCIWGTAAPIPGATVTVLQGGATATTDANGIYQFGRSVLSPGAYTVTASKVAYVRQTKSATVSETAITYRNFNLAVSGKLKGQVKDKVTGANLVGATVFARSGGIIWATTTTTSPYGVYEMNADLPPGTYVVQASQPGYVAQNKKDIIVTAGATTYVNFNLYYSAK